MATGKSRVGKALADMLLRDFFDSDDYIEKSSGMTIADIFQSYGEGCFRKLERKAVFNLSQHHQAVISLGGGAVIDQKNWQRIKQTGLSVCLWADTEVLVDRIARKKTRPLMAGYSKSELKERIEFLLHKRTPYYSRADYCFESREDVAADQLADKIFKILWNDYAST